MSNQEHGHDMDGDLSQCFTPDLMVKQMIDSIPEDKWDGANVLEPSAGDGQLVAAILKKPIKSLTIVEIDERFYDHLVEQFGDDPRVTIIHADFLEWSKENN